MQNFQRVGVDSLFSSRYPRGRYPADELHHEVGTPGFRGAAIKNLGDILMIHHRQHLVLDLKTGNNLLAAYSQTNDLELDSAPPFRHIDHPPSPIFSKSL